MNRRSHLRAALGCVLGLVFLPWALAQQATPPGDLPTGEAILDRYVEVTGGAAAYQSRTSEMAAGTLAIAAAGITGQLRAIAKPGFVRTTIEIPGVGVIDRGVTDGVAWESNPITGPRIVEGFEGALMVAGARPGATGRWREMYSAVNATGIEEVDGKPAYRVVHSLGTNGSLTGFYAVDSGLLVKIAIGPGIEQHYEAYAEHDGILSPTRVVTTGAGQRTVITFTSMEANVEIPDERFDPPEDVKALLQ